MSTVTIEPLGESAVLIRLGDVIDARINRTAIALAASLRARPLPGLIDIAPAFASVCVRFDAMRWSHDTFADVVDDALASIDIDAQSDARDVIEIPVCYGTEFGPDLQDVADHARMSVADIIELHRHGEYIVAMVGFMPGFPYLRGLDARLHTPRRATPRLRVPAGSVAIGGAQTGIYPREIPGGWQIIGRTPLNLFDATRDSPALLRPGQRVVFTRIDETRFANWPT